MLFDFHTHITLKAFHSNDRTQRNRYLPNPNHWLPKTVFSEDEDRYNKLIDKLEKSLIIRSQSHLEAIHKGGLRVATVALYPLEHGFTEPKGLIENIADLLSLDIDKAIASVIGISHEAVKMVKQRKYSYYTFLKSEIDNLINGIKPHTDSHGQIMDYQVVANYDELKELRQNRPNTIALILSIEGAHVFINNVIEPLLTKLTKNVYAKKHNQEAQQWANATCENIDDFKLNYPSTFFVTFAHHFFNLMCGQAYTMSTSLFNQRPARYGRKGFNQYGLQILDKLLERKTAGTTKLRRILIDTKHMSALTRVQYHDYVFNARITKDWIPILQSHTAVSGRPSMRNVAKLHSGGAMWRKKPYPTETIKYKNQLVHLALNLFDDEIKEIIDSGGLMGIMLDEKRIRGKHLPEDVNSIDEKRITLDVRDKKSLLRKYILKRDVKKKYLKKKYFKKILIINNTKNYKEVQKLLSTFLFIQKYCLEDLSDGNLPASKIAELKRDQLEITSIINHIRGTMKPISASLVLNQLLYIAEIGGPTALEHVCIGSDFDGIINPLDTYPDASYLNTLGDDLISHWSEMLQKGDQRYDTFRHGKDPTAIIDDLLWNNAKRFLKRYFTEAYLRDGIHPNVPKIVLDPA